MKIFYWSPFISKVATISSVMRSAESIIKYRNKTKEVRVSIIDAIGEWEDYKKKINPEIDIINLNKKNFSKVLPQNGYLQSRISFLFIFFLNFFKLKNLIFKYKPDFLIIHLMTSLPIFLSIFNLKETKIILRLSGLPRLNIFRYFFWKFFSNKIYKVTCPTIATYDFLVKTNIFNKNKIHVLRDPAIILNDYASKKFENFINFKNDKKKLIVSIGRLTRQKNFDFLIKGFKKINEKYPNYTLLILGDGELKLKLNKLIDELNLKKNVFLLGFQKNVYKYLYNADCFILSSLWEDPGFVLLEAGLSNTNVISSDCKNGPKEIIDNEKNGFLYKNNDLNDFLKKFDEFKNADIDKLKVKKINLKKEIKKFTMYSHYNALNQIIFKQ